MAYRFGEFELSRDRYELRRAGVLVAAEPRVLEVLAYLIEHRDRIVPRKELIDALWPQEYVTDSALTRAVREARRIVGDRGSESRWIKTVYGRGVGWIGEVEVVDPDVAPRREDDSGPREAGLPQSAIASAPHDHSRASPLRRSLLWLVPVVAVAILALMLKSGGEAPPATSARVALLPISVEGDDPELQLIAISLGDLLETRLQQVRNLAVNGPDYARPARGDRASAIAQFARETRATNLLSGTLRRSHDRGKSHLEVTLHQVRDGGRIHDTPLGQFDIPLLRSPTDIQRYAGIRDSIAEQVATTLLPAVATLPAGHLTPRDADAYRLFCSQDNTSATARAARR